MRIAAGGLVMRAFVLAGFALIACAQLDAPSNDNGLRVAVRESAIDEGVEPDAVTQDDVGLRNRPELTWFRLEVVGVLIRPQKDCQRYAVPANFAREVANLGRAGDNLQAVVSVTTGAGASES
jgi:hypothetical protein